MRGDLRRFGQKSRFLSPDFFCFLFFADSGFVYADGNNKKLERDTEHERVQFWGTTELEESLTRTPHGTLKSYKIKRQYPGETSAWDVRAEPEFFAFQSVPIAFFTHRALTDQSSQFEGFHF